MDGGAEEGGRGSTSGGDAEGGGSPQEEENAIDHRNRQSERGDQGLELQWFTRAGEGPAGVVVLIPPSHLHLSHDFAISTPSPASLPSMESSSSWECSPPSETPPPPAAPPLPLPPDAPLTATPRLRRRFLRFLPRERRRARGFQTGRRRVEDINMGRVRGGGKCRRLVMGDSSPSPQPALASPALPPEMPPSPPSQPPAPDIDPLAAMLEEAIDAPLPPPPTPGCFVHTLHRCHTH